MQQLVEALAGAGDVKNIPVPLELEYMGHSAIIGTILMLILAWATAQGKSEGGKGPKTPSEILLASSNVLFLSFGMTGVMMLVNNNLARAFAIGAAIALIRFRVKVDNKTLAMSLLYGVLTGMACGVGEISMAYAIVVFFGILQFTIASAARILERREMKTAEMKSAEMKSAEKKSVIAKVPNQPIVVVEQAKAPTTPQALVEV